MKRNERNLISRRKILDSAFEEFAKEGYGRSSVNTICTGGNISKGILYHYFKDKDELYLVCVGELFDGLTQYLSAELSDASGTNQTRLERYFDARLRFFHDHPLYHKLFCDVVIAPPPALKVKILEIRAAFDALNIAVLTELLEEQKLRRGVTMESAVETFRIYQDFINAIAMETCSKIDPKEHEEICKRSLDILLYGIVKREEV